MSPLLKNIYASEGGSEALDVLMKYMCVLETPTTTQPARQKLLY